MYYLGAEKTAKLTKMKVLIYGLRGIGVETCKNLALQGVGAITVSITMMLMMIIMKIMMMIINMSCYGDRHSIDDFDFNYKYYIIHNIGD